MPESLVTTVDPSAGPVEWPVFLSQPDGEQPGLLVPPPEPWSGEPLPEGLTLRLRPREVPIWVGNPIGRPKWRTDWDRYRLVAPLMMLGTVFTVMAVSDRHFGFGVAAVVAITLAAFTVSYPPQRRKRRRLQTWWVLTPERFGGLCLAEPIREVWIERGEVREVKVRGLTKDGSGTLVVVSEPERSFESGGMEWVGGLVVGRIADAESVAEQIRVLRYELS